MNGPAWTRAAALVLLLLLLHAAGDTVRTALRLDAAAIAHGQWWRLVTAHLVHLSWPHTLLNAAGVLLCCALAPAVFDRHLPWRLAVLALGVGLCLWRFSPGVLPYVGLSGVLYGLFAQGLVPQALRKDFTTMAALFVLTAWMLWQQVNIHADIHQIEARWIGGRIVAVAHQYGYALALLFAGLTAGSAAGLARWRTRHARRQDAP